MFSGVTILQGVEFPIFLLIFAWALQQCSATVLPVMNGGSDVQVNDILTFMPSQRDTARNGRRARSVLRARNAPMLPIPIPSAPRLINDICTDRKTFTETEKKILHKILLGQSLLFVARHSA